MPTTAGPNTAALVKRYLHGPGADMILGAGGEDTVSYQSSETGVEIHLALNENEVCFTQQGGGAAEGDLLETLRQMPPSRPVRLLQRGLNYSGPAEAE